MKTRVLFPLIFSISACSSWTPTQDAGQTNISGAGSLFEDKRDFLGRAEPGQNFTTLDYCSLLIRYGIATLTTTNSCEITSDVLEGLSPQIRNEIQDYVLAASNQKCGEYVKLLHSLRGDTDVFWGGLATLFAGAGAVLSHAPTAQALSAAGAVSSGVRSEFSQAYFANLAIEVVASGIESRRKEILDTINKNRVTTVTVKSASGTLADVTTVYSLNGAISDALDYHAACNAITGLEVAAESITRADNPGALELGKFIKDLNSAGIAFSFSGEQRPTPADTGGAIVQPAAQNGATGESSQPQPSDQVEQNPPNGANPTPADQEPDQPTLQLRSTQ